MIRVLSIDDDGATPHGGGHADAAVIYGMATITGDANGPRWRPREAQPSTLCCGRSGMEPARHRPTCGRRWTGGATVPTVGVRWAA